jgi:hypothetical protein
MAKKYVPPPERNSGSGNRFGTTGAAGRVVEELDGTPKTVQQLADSARSRYPREIAEGDYRFPALDRLADTGKIARIEGEDGKKRYHTLDGLSARLVPSQGQAIPQTIRIDAEVWLALQKLAVPFVETPNDVLRRLLGLGNRKES